MPENAHADLLCDWDLLLAAVANGDVELGGAECHRRALAAAVEEFYAVQAGQQLAAAEAVELTRRKNEALARGREAAIRLRSMLRAILGPRNTRLSAFGIAPLRRR